MTLYYDYSKYLAKGPADWTKEHRFAIVHFDTESYYTSDYDGTSNYVSRDATKIYLFDSEKDWKEAIAVAMEETRIKGEFIVLRDGIPVKVKVNYTVELD